ncbi:MAG: FAD-binding protein [Candidatus Syntrophopropionicum ammoniitolerans]
MSAKNTFISDVLVIGAGLAAERSAIECAAVGHSVIILSLVSRVVPTVLLPRAACRLLWETLLWVKVTAQKSTLPTP